MSDSTIAVDGGTAYGADGFINSGKYFYLGYDGDINNSFILFPCNIPKGHVAEGCILDVVTSIYTGISHPPIKLRLSALAADNAAIPSSYSEWAAMQRTSAHFDFEINSYERFPELLQGFDDVITEIAARPGWEPGNNILLFIDDNGTEPSYYNFYVKCKLLQSSVSSRPSLYIDRWPLATIVYDTVGNEIKFNLTLSGNSGERANWTQLFDNTVWTGKDTEATAVWDSTRWALQAGTKYSTDYASITATGTDFDTFRPVKFRVYFTGADTITIRLHHSNSEYYDYADISSGDELYVFWDIYAITKIEFIRTDIYEIYPYITNIEFYDSDYVPTVIDDVTLPVSNMSITYRLEMRDTEGNIMPFWDSAANPGDNGYSLVQSKYRITGTATVPGYAYISDIADRMNNTIDILVSEVTTNGIPDFQEFLTDIELTKAVPSKGANSVSVQLTFEKTVSLSEFTWLYFVKEYGKHNFISPNGANGENNITFPYFIGSMKPGYSLLLTGSDTQYNISEVQWIANTSGITTYMKE